MLPGRDGGAARDAGTGAGCDHHHVLRRASLLIEKPGGVRAVTDYNGVNVPAEPPDIVMINHSHSTHWTDHSDPRIPHLLHGWRDGCGPAQINLTVGGLRVSNLPVPTSLG